LCRWPRIRPLCNNPNGHDQTFQSSHIIWRPPESSLITIGLLVANSTDHWVTYSPMGHWSDCWVSFQWMAIDQTTGVVFQWLFDQTLGSSQNDCQGPPQEQPIFLSVTYMHAYILDSCQVWSRKTILSFFASWMLWKLLTAPRQRTERENCGIVIALIISCLQEQRTGYFFQWSSDSLSKVCRDDGPLSLSLCVCLSRSCLIVAKRTTLCCGWETPG
jgi:hypothetical protein